MLKILWVCALSVAAYGAAVAGDAAVGKAKADAICSECHEKADWAEEDAASLEAKISSVVAGKTKHKKKLSLTDEEIKGIAAYWAGK
jgi:cytochrome c553